MRSSEEKTAQSATLKRPSRFSFEVLDKSADFEEIVFLARRAHEESRFSYIDFSPEKVRTIAKKALNNPTHHVGMLCRDPMQAVGFLYCSVGEYHIGTGTLVTTIHNINVLPEIRHSLGGGQVAMGLLKGAHTWSTARGVTEIFFHVTSDVELGKTHKFIKRLGYHFIGGSYAKKLF